MTASLTAPHLTTGSSCWFWQPFLFKTGSWQVEDYSSAKVKIQTVGRVFLCLSCQIFWCLVEYGSPCRQYCKRVRFSRTHIFLTGLCVMCVRLSLSTRLSRKTVSQRGSFVCAVGVCVAFLGFVCVSVCVFASVRAFPSVCLVLSQGGNSGGRSLQRERPWAFGVQRGLFTARAPP